jgi:hypothetical protein
LFGFKSYKFSHQSKTHAGKKMCKTKQPKGIVSQQFALVINRVRSGNRTNLTKTVRENFSAIWGLTSRKTTIPSKKNSAFWWSENEFKNS